MSAPRSHRLPSGNFPPLKSAFPLRLLRHDSKDGRASNLCRFRRTTGGSLSNAPKFTSELDQLPGIREFMTSRFWKEIPATLVTAAPAPVGDWGKIHTRTEQ